MKHDKPSAAPGAEETPLAPPSNAGQGLRARILFLLAALLPLFLDIFTGGYLLTSVLGAALWGLLILVAVLEPRSRDLKLRRLLRQSQQLLWGLWLAGWAASVVSHGNLDASSPLLAPLSRAWLVRIHAFLLAGASGLVLLFGVSSLASILQMKRLRSSSWSRRSSAFQLPSLESLARVSSSAVFWSFCAWGVGLSLATLTLVVSLESRSFSGEALQNLLADPKIVLTCFLWVLLGVAFLVQTRTRMMSITRAYWLASLSGAFWIFLTMHAWLDTSSFHEPLRWFLR